MTLSTAEKERSWVRSKSRDAGTSDTPREETRTSDPVEGDTEEKSVAEKVNLMCDWVTINRARGVLQIRI